MATDEARLLVRLEATTAKLERAMAKADQVTRATVDRMESRFRQSNAKITAGLEASASRYAELGRIAGGALGALVGGIGVQQTLRSARLAVAEMSNLAKIADRVSLPVEEFQALQYAMELSGVTTEQFNVAMSDFGAKVGQAATGTGEMVNVMKAYGVSIRNADGSLKGQSVLLREFADLIRGLSTDSERLAVAQAAFGEGGRAMVLALKGGADGIEGMIAAARAAGAVVEEDLIRKAEVLDDKFAQLTRSAQTFFRTIVVGAAENVGLVADLDSMFGGADQARSALGSELYDALIRNNGALEQNAEQVGQVRHALEELQRVARSTGDAIGNELGALIEVGADDLARQLADVASEMEALVADVAAGRAPADELATKLQDVIDRAMLALQEASAIDGVSMDNAVAAVGRLSGALRITLGFAAGVVDKLREAAGLAPAAGGGRGNGALRITLGFAAGVVDKLREAAGLAPAAGGGRGNGAAEMERRRADLASPLAPSSSPRPRPAPNDIDFDLPAETFSRGGGGAGGASDVLEIAAREIATLEQRLALIGKTDAEVARLTTRFTLLQEAQRRGLDLDAMQVETGRTLRQEIEAQAAAVGNLAAQADQYAARAEVLTDAMGSLQDGFLDAIVSGKDLSGTLADLARQLAKAALQAALFNTGPFAGGGGGGGLLEVLFGGLFGKRASGGPVIGGKPYLVGERGPELIVPPSAARVIPNGRAGGGGGPVQLNVSVSGARGNSEIQAMVSAGVTQALTQYDRQVLPVRVQQVSGDPRRRG